MVGTGLNKPGAMFLALANMRLTGADSVDAGRGRACTDLSSGRRGPTFFHVAKLWCNHPPAPVELTVAEHCR